MHLEIETNISDENNRRFIDCDTFGKEVEHLGRSETLLPGESFEQKMCFLPGWTDNEFVGFENAKIKEYFKVICSLIFSILLSIFLLLEMFLFVSIKLFCVYGGYYVFLYPHKIIKPYRKIERI